MAMVANLTSLTNFKESKVIKKCEIRLCGSSLQEVAKYEKKFQTYFVKLTKSDEHKSVDFYRSDFELVTKMCRKISKPFFDTNNNTIIKTIL